MADNPKAPLLTSMKDSTNKYGMQEPGPSDEKVPMKLISLPPTQDNAEQANDTPLPEPNKTSSAEPTPSTLFEKESKKSPSKVKKKQPGFLQREIVITNPEKVNRSMLLEVLHERFTKGFEKWRKRAKVFKLANLTITLLVIAIQVTQVTVFQVPNLSNNVKTILATILPAITGAMLAIQLKLAWAEKGAKCKQSAKLFNVLTSHTEYRKKMAASGGEASDVDLIKLWNTALLSESKDVPAFLLAY